MGLRAASAADTVPRMSQTYFRQLGVRTNWHSGDTAYWRGQPCSVVRCVPEDQPVSVVIQTPRGTEITTDFCLLSEAPALGSSQVMPPRTGDSSIRPTRLAPLGDLCLERPPSIERPLMLPSPRSSGGSSGSRPGSNSLQTAGFAVANRLDSAARARSPLRPLSREQ